MSKLTTTSFNENLRRADKLGLVRGGKPAAKSAARQAEDLGKQAADVYEKAVGIAGRAPGSAAAKQAGKIATGMIADVLSRRLKG